MSDPATEFAGLQAMHGSVVLLKEGGQHVALLPVVRAGAGSRPSRS